MRYFPINAIEKQKKIRKYVFKKIYFHHNFKNVACYVCNE